MTAVNLESSTALVTGSSKNIGRAIAVRLAEAGADVGITARGDRAGCEETLELVEETGASGTVVLGDIGEPGDITHIVENVRSDLGAIDILVNNAAIRPATSFDEITLEDWDRVHNVNARSIFLFAREIVPDMRAGGGGAIVNLHGEIVNRGARGKVHVGSSKTAAVGLTLSLATTFAPENIRVNGVCPGRLIRTDRKMENYPNFEHMERNVIEATPMRRRGEAGEIADAVCFLASEQASFVAGQILSVNGGLFPTIHLNNVGLEEE